MTTPPKWILRDDQPGLMGLPIYALEESGRAFAWLRIETADDEARFAQIMEARRLHEILADLMISRSVVDALRTTGGDDLLARAEQALADLRNSMPPA